MKVEEYAPQVEDQVSDGVINQVKGVGVID
jgi:hypothetical protein